MLHYEHKYKHFHQSIASRVTQQNKQTQCSKKVVDSPNRLSMSPIRPYLGTYDESAEIE